MHITDIIRGNSPTFSFEFFPPKTPEAAETLYQTIRDLEPLAGKAGISKPLCAARRAVLEKTLIAPVRAYQQDLLPLANRAAPPRDAPSENDASSNSTFLPASTASCR